MSPGTDMVHALSMIHSKPRVSRHVTIAANAPPIAEQWLAPEDLIWYIELLITSTKHTVRLIDFLD